MRDYQMVTVTVVGGKAVNTLITEDEMKAIKHAESCVRDYVSDAKEMGKPMPTQVVVIKQNKDYNEIVWEWTEEDEEKE